MGHTIWGNILYGNSLNTYCEVWVGWVFTRDLAMGKVKALYTFYREGVISEQFYWAFLWTSEDLDWLDLLMSIDIFMSWLAHLLLGLLGLLVSC